MISKKLVLKSNYKEIKRAREELKKLAKECNINFEKVFYLEIVIGEIVANIVEHGISKFNKDIIFEIKIEDNEEIIFVFEYYGKYISFEMLEEYTRLKEVTDIEDLECEGRGVFLIHELMDEVVYETFDENKIKITMKKNK